MKVNELFEAVELPKKNRKLGFRNKGEKVETGKHGYPTGGTKEWLKTFNASETDVSHALRVVRQSQEYRDVKATGMEDQSTERHNKNGSIVFVGYIPAGGRMVRRNERVKVTVQANGKMDETAANDFHRAPLTSPKPHIVPGDAVSSIAKTMRASMAKLASTMERRKKQAEADAKRANQKSYS